MKKFIKSQTALQIVACTVIATFVIAGVVSAASTIGTNISTAGTLAVTGASTLTGATTVTGATVLNGGLTMDTDKFTVADTSGNTAIGGTLAVTGASTLTGATTVTGATVLNGGLTMDTDKFTVADTSGNTAIGGTLAVTGATTMTDLTVSGTFTPAITNIANNFSIGDNGDASYTLTGNVSGTDTVMTFGNGDITVTTGTLTVANLLNANGGIAVDTTQFTVSGTNGNVTIATPNSMTTGTLLSAAGGTFEATGAVTGLSVDLSNATGNAQTVYGIDVKDLGTAGAGNEYGIYVEGTDWDYGLYVIDAAKIDGALTVGGTLALGANALTMTGDLAATGARVTKGWFTDVESTNMPTVAGTSLSSTFQAIDTDLTSLAALGTAADKMAYTTGANVWAEAPITAAGRAILDDADAAAQLVTLGAAPLASPTFTGTVTIPTPFTIGAVSMTSTAAELNILDGATLTVTELNYVDGVTSALQTQLDAKSPLASPTFTGTVTIPTPFTIGAVSMTSTAAELNILDGATLTVTELNYVDGVTSGIQTQLDAKQAIDTDLTSLAALGTAASKMAYTTDAHVWAETAVTTAGLAILDDADAATQRTTLGAAPSASPTFTGNVIKSVTAAVVGAGTDQGTATALTTDLNYITEGISASGVKLPVAVAGMDITILNSVGNTIHLYSAVAETVNGIAAGTGILIDASTGTRCIAISTSAWKCNTVGAIDS